MGKLITTKQAASMLGLSSATVRTLINRGTLPAIILSNKCRNTIRINASDVEAIINFGGFYGGEESNGLSKLRKQNEFRGRVLQVSRKIRQAQCLSK